MSTLAVDPVTLGVRPCRSDRCLPRARGGRGHAELHPRVAEMEHRGHLHRDCILLPKRPGHTSDERIPTEALDRADSHFGRGVPNSETYSLSTFWSSRAM